MHISLNDKSIKLVITNVMLLVFILFRRIKCFKKDAKLKREAEALAAGPDDDLMCLRSELVEGNWKGDFGNCYTAMTGGGGEEKLVFAAGFDDVMLRLSLDIDEATWKGDFGYCFKAVTEAGDAAVTMKRLVDLRPLSSEEFMRHVRDIAEIKHPNLLPLLAFYQTEGSRLFVYPFAPYGNLYLRLHGGRGTTERVPFRWRSRVTAALCVARALEHLHRHSESEPHGNLKSSSVALDEKEGALVCDYGLTSLAAAQRMVCHKTPEYQSGKPISKKSDVWSYGCLVLELLTGWIPAAGEVWTAEIFDPEIAVSSGDEQLMLRLMQIAMKCCDETPEKRPEIGQVVVDVEKVSAAVDSEKEELTVKEWNEWKEWTRNQSRICTCNLP